MPQKYEYKKSNLTIEREKSITGNHIGKEGFDSLFQGDLYTQSLKQQLEYSTHDIFAERFSKEPIADEQLDKKIGDMHSEIFKGKTLGSMAKGKRVKAAKEKIELQKHLLDEQKILLSRREEDREHGEREYNYIRKSDIKMAFVSYGGVVYTESQLEQIPRFMLK